MRQLRRAAGALRGSEAPAHGARAHLVVGLANPGRRYANTRHNVGGEAVQLLARKHAIPMEARRANATVGTGSVSGSDVTLAVPRTFMNESGGSVGPLVRRTNTPMSRLLVVYDDLDLPLGTTRLRPYGSAGGHNGMRSIIAALGADRFARLRIGIGRPEAAGRDAVGHVLGRFSADEKPRLAQTLDRAVECIEVMLTDGLEQAMNQYN